MGEVEAQAIGSHQRAGLLDVKPHQLAEGGMEQVGGGVVLPDGIPADPVHPSLDPVAHLQGSPGAPDPVSRVAGRGGIGVLHDGFGLAALQDPGVSHLPSCFRIEGGPVQEDLSHLSGRQQSGLLPLDQDALDDCLIGIKLGVAQESGLLRGGWRDRAGVGSRFLPTGASPLALSREPPVETLFIQDQSILVRNLLHQVQGEAVGVVELEHDLTRQPAPVGPGRFQPVQHVTELVQRNPQRGGEALFLVAHHPGHVLPRRGQLRIGLLHEIRHPVGHAVQKFILDSDEPSVPDGATHDLAQDIAAAVIGGNNPVADQEGRRPGMIRDHPHGYVAGLVAAVVPS